MQVTTIILVEEDEEDIEFFTSVVHQIAPTIKVNVATSKDRLLAEMLLTTPVYIVKSPTLQEVKTVLLQIFSFERGRFPHSKRYYSNGIFNRL